MRLIELDQDRTTAQIFADGTQYSYQYDRESNRVQSTDARGSVAMMSYDRLNRVVMVSVQRGVGVVGTSLSTAEYDGLDRVTKQVEHNDPNNANDNHEVETSYDSLGHAIQEVQDGFAIDRQYDSLGNSLNTVYPNSAKTLTYSFDQLDRVSSVSMKTGAVTQPLIQR